ncbi:MAG: hypothetical protein E7Z90_05745 [Cyanobacteria bacterium SIG29]|nr:hypothetical protein [Cyanobacteria bacterium SIG29]
MNAQSNNNISFCAAQTAIYAVDEEGNYQKFDGRRDAERKLQIHGSSISQCLNGKRNTAGGYMFVLASEIERTTPTGKVKVDKKKLDEKINSIKEKSLEDKSKKPIYAIDKDGNYKKYSSIKEAAKDIGASDSNISKCLKGSQHTAQDFGFLYAEDIERIGSNGEIRISKVKINQKQKEIIAALSTKAVIRPFYAIDKNGEYQKFERNSDASKTLGVHHSKITQCLNGQRDTTGGFAFVFADEAESFDENGNLILNFNIDNEKFDQRTPIPVYSINRHGRIKKFNSIGEAATKLSLPKRNIKNCIEGERETVLGYSFINADEVETIGKNGEIKIDYTKFEDKFQQVIKNAVYVVNGSGKFKRYDSSTEAAKALGVSQSTILFCANGIQRGINEQTVVKAKYVESFSPELKRLIFNTDLINKFANEAAKLAERPVLAIDKNNKRRKFKNRTEAAKALGIRSDKMTRCLNGQQKSTGGYTLVYEDVAEKRQKTSTIYALDRAGDVHEYKNVEEAAKALGVEKEEILVFLKKGTTKDKQPTLKGYVFATDSDE